MFPAEARRIADLVTRLDLEPGDICLNIGASTRHFREVEQPHIEHDLLAPLRKRGLRIVHSDLKSADGVDISGDLLDPAVQERLRAVGAKLLLCCNLLEHLTDPQGFATACAGLVPPGGWLVVSVPLSFPYHRDPIDTLFRPTPEQIAALFPGLEPVHREVLTLHSFWHELMDAPGGGWRLARHLVQVAMPFYRPRKWLERAHRLLWLHRPYRVSLAILRCPPAPDRAAAAGSVPARHPLAPGQ